MGLRLVEAEFEGAHNSRHSPSRLAVFDQRLCIPGNEGLTSATLKNRRPQPRIFCDENVDPGNERIKENEPFDVALRRFKRSCEKAGVLAEVRSREFYEKPTSERKRKAAAAVKRHAKKVQREQRRAVRLY